MYSTDASFPTNFTLCKLKWFSKFLNQSLLINLVSSNAVLVPSAPVVTWKLFFFLQASGFFLNYICIQNHMFPVHIFIPHNNYLFNSHKVFSFKLWTTMHRLEHLWKIFSVFLYRACRAFWVTNQIYRNHLCSS